jgi:hypothetical protein
MDPIIWSIDGQDMRLKASVDVTELGTIAEGLRSDIENAEDATMAAMARRRKAMLDLVGLCIEPDDLDTFLAVSEDFDLAILLEMVQEVIAEYSGAANPTKPSSSSDGSSTTGATSTDGALPGV